MFSHTIVLDATRAPLDTPDDKKTPPNANEEE
jgi:hypothetical protein